MRLMVRGDKAYFVVPCHDGESHSTVLNLNGEMESRIGSHNFDEERVIEILGGAPSNCAKIHRIYTAALLSYKAKYGIADPVGITSNSSDEFWRSTEVCFYCRQSTQGSRMSELQHFASAAHNACCAGVGEYTPLVKRLIGWFERKSLLGIDSQSALSFDIPELAYMARQFGSSDAAFNESFCITRRYLLTPNYVRIAEKFVGKNAANVLALRSYVPIQRLTTILEEVGESNILIIKDKMRRKNGLSKNFATMLSANRSVPTSVIIDFLKAGIYANIYTYSNNDATAHQAVRVYSASRGVKTLKDYLLEGVSAIEAVRIAERCREDYQEGTLQ